MTTDLRKMMTSLTPTVCNIMALFGLLEVWALGWSMVYGTCFASVKRCLLIFLHTFWGLQVCSNIWALDGFFLVGAGFEVWALV